MYGTTNMQLSKNTCHMKTFNNNYNKLSLGNLQYYVRTKQLKDITTNKGELDMGSANGLEVPTRQTPHMKITTTNLHYENIKLQ